MGFPSVPTPVSQQNKAQGKIRVCLISRCVFCRMHTTTLENTRVLGSILLYRQKILGKRSNAFPSQHLGVRGRRIIMSSKPTMCTKSVQSYLNYILDRSCLTEEKREWVNSASLKSKIGHLRHHHRRLLNYQYQRFSCLKK